MSEELLTPDEMAEVFEVSRTKVLHWNRIYDWPCIKVGRRIRWTKDQLEDIKARHTVTSSAKPATDTRTKRSASARRS